ncbi:MAG: PEP-CTERM sorting domain-containing protein [bacterium]
MKGILNAHKYLVITLAIVISLAFLSSAQALQVTLWDGTNAPLTVADGDLNDSNSATGYVTYIGNYGTFVMNVTTGSSKPGIGSANVPMMDINSFETSSSSGGTIQVSVSDNGFGPMNAGLSGFHIEYSGTTPGTVSGAVYWDDTDALYDPLTGAGTQHLISSLPAQTGSFGVEDNPAGIPANSPFSLTMIATITHTGAQFTSLDFSLVPTPEPGTILLVGLGLLGLGIIGRKKMEV